jgi:hypothetical protein
VCAGAGLEVNCLAASLLDLLQISLTTAILENAL